MCVCVYMCVLQYVDGFYNPNTYTFGYIFPLCTQYSHGRGKKNTICSQIITIIHIVPQIITIKMPLFPQISLPYIIYIYIWTIYVDFGIHISSPEALLRSAMTSPLLPLKELKVALPLAVTWRMGSRFLPVVVKLPVLSTRHRDFFMNLQLVGGLEHEFYDFPYIGNSNPNWLSYFSEG